MKIKQGEEIYFKLLPDMKIYNGTVITSKNNSITLKLQKDILKGIAKGNYIIITHQDNDFYAEVEYFDGSTMKTNLLWAEKREYFRVDDFIPVVTKKVKDNGQCRRSRIFSGYGTTVQNELVPDETINPVLWKMLLDIQAKLGLIIERMSPDSQSLLGVESKNVNISAAGICLVLDEKLSKGDLLEIKMLLPNYPPIGLVIYGRVVRSTEIEDEQYKTAISFDDIEDEIRDEIIQYTLRRQRDIMKKQKNKRE